jgi:branched-chain amino acid transport system substrate-binding protein
MSMRSFAHQFALSILCFFCIAIPTHASDAIKVGFSVSLTGRYAEPGRDQYRGIEMWASDLNNRGALLGRPVELVYYDDASSPDKSARIYQRLIEEDKVDLLIGPYASDTTLAASSVAERFNFPMVAAGAAAEKIWDRGYRNIFGIDNPASDYMDRVVEFAQIQGLKRIALVYAETSFTSEVAEGVRREAARLNMQLVFDEGYDDTTDLASLTQRMRPTRPDIIIGGTYKKGAYGLLRHVKAAEISPKILAFTVAPALWEFGQTLGADAEGVMGPVVWIRSDRIPMAHDFSFRYKERYGNNAGHHAAYGYAAGQVLEAALRLAGSLDKSKVRRQLSDMTFLSLLGRYKVDETGKQIGNKTHVIQWQDGRRRLVLPERLAEKPLRYPFTPWSER